MNPLTTTDMNEYHMIPAALRRERGQRAYLQTINDFVGVDMVNDRIIRLQKRRQQLRRRGAY